MNHARLTYEIYRYSWFPVTFEPPCAKRAGAPSSAAGSAGVMRHWLTTQRTYSLADVVTALLAWQVVVIAALSLWWLPE